MILTDRFVYIHLPKTGGTFVTDVLERLMKPPKPNTWAGRAIRNLRGRRYHDTNKHGTSAEIPPSHRGLPVLGCVRNPFDRYVSQYEFAWWKEKPPRWLDRGDLLRRYPRFPDLTFEEFVDLSSTSFHRLRGNPLDGDDRVGYHTEQFVRYYYRDPAGAWPRIDDAYVAARRWTADLDRVRLLRTERLNEDLHAFLVGIGFAAAEVAWVLEEGRILPEGSKRDPRRPWPEWYTPALRARVRRRERMIFAMFPEYDAP